MQADERPHAGRPAHPPYGKSPRADPHHWPCLAKSCRICRSRAEYCASDARPRTSSSPISAVHGASSAWFRLKWITDFAALDPWRPDGAARAASIAAPRIWRRPRGGAGAAPGRFRSTVRLGEHRAQAPLRRDWQNRWLWRIGFAPARRTAGTRRTDVAPIWAPRRSIIRSSCCSRARPSNSPNSFARLRAALGLAAPPAAGAGVFRNRSRPKPCRCHHERRDAAWSE